LNCAGAPAPYIAVCSSEIAMNRWNAADQQLEIVVPEFSGLDLVAGTALRPGS
jgi:branched-chain amino acid transport system substrate-binding protein